MLKKLIQQGAKAKVLSNRDKIREQIATTYKDDFPVIVDAVSREIDIVPLLPEYLLENLKKHLSFADSLNDAAFLLELTKEILPEYALMLSTKEPWLRRQLALVRERIG